MNATIPHALFLLGGYDLEMMLIKQMLEERGNCVVIDRILNWSNAKLSAYKNLWNDYAGWDIYGVELQEDCPLPPLYHRIDHHNEQAGNPSSLEQVAQLMGITLSRDQQLAAANDRGYIPAMMAMGATDEEIANIRKRDRTAQGICEKDEQLAEQSLRVNMSKHGDLIVIRSLTSHFSPICDRLFPYCSLLIYTDAEWMFYGQGKDKLVRQFANEIKQKRIFHGSGDSGFIGTVQHAYSKEEISQVVKQIIEEYGSL